MRGGGGAPLKADPVRRNVELLSCSHRHGHAMDNHPSVCPSIHPSYCHPMHPSTDQSIRHPSVNHAVYIHPFIRPSNHLSILLFPFTCLSIYRSIYLPFIHLSSMHPSICPSIHQSSFHLCLFVHQYIYLSINLSTSVFLSICFSIHQSDWIHECQCIDRQMTDRGMMDPSISHSSSYPSIPGMTD